MEDFIKDRKNLIIIYGLMIVSIILTLFVIPNFFPTHYRILNLVIWFIIFLFARKVSNQHNRFKGQSEEMKTIFIIVFIYLIVYYLSGLIFGYSQSIYSHTLKGILYNILLFVVVILFQEYTRSRLINNTRSSFLYFLITLMFIVLGFNYNNFSDNFSTAENAFKFISSQIYPAIIRGILCSYLVRIGSYKLSLMFILPLTLVEYLTPVFPNIDWFITVAFESILVILIYYFVSYEHSINTERYTRQEIRYSNPKTVLPGIIFVVIFAFFVAGLLPIKPVAILSNSMKPYFKRGDVVLVTKVKKENLKNICVGDVVEYKIDGKTVVHRVSSIVEGSGNEIYFITKGDANDLPDSNPVTEDQIIGIAKNYIPYIGYPSVIFSEKILKIGN